VVDLDNARALRDFKFSDMDLRLLGMDEDGGVDFHIDSYDYGKLGPFYITQQELRELLRLSEWMTSDG
jgi:hypothetical protein